MYRVITMITRNNGGKFMRKFFIVAAALAALAVPTVALAADTAGGSGDAQCQTTNSAMPYGDNANHFGVQKSAADGRESGNAQSAFYRCTIWTAAA